MRIGTIIKEYRSIHKLSMEKFAELAGKSKGYISMLEKGENPNTKKPISPSLETLQNIASAMNMDFDILVSQLDDNQLISNSTTLSVYPDFLTHQTTDKIENIQDIANRIRELRLANNLEQTEVADYLGYKSDTTVSKWENGKNLPTGAKLVKLAKLFNTTTDYILHGKDINTTASPDLLTQQITDKVVQLTPDNKKIVLRTSEELLERQKANGEMYTEQNEEETKINEVSEEVINLYQVEVVSEAAAACGFNYGFGYDDTDRETIEVDEQPPRHDIATKVSGDSMQPDYQDGDILYLVDKGLTTYNGDLAIIAYGDRSYFKKIYTENGRLRLVSLNDKYEDITLDFPPAEDTHIKIYAVVGVYRGE